MPYASPPEFRREGRAGHLELSGRRARLPGKAYSSHAFCMLSPLRRFTIAASALPWAVLAAGNRPGAASRDIGHDINATYCADYVSTEVLLPVGEVAK